MSRDANQPADRPAAEESFLQRWARRKHAARRDAAAACEAPAARETPMREQPLPAFGQSPARMQPPAPAAAPAEPTTASNAAPGQPPPPLPPIESLTFDSDFSAFLAPHVPEELKRQALKKLLHDPRFNVMDGLDVYIDDYSTPSPLAPELVRGLAQARYIFDPPPTRVNAEGHVEDIPAEERTDLAASSPSDALPDAVEANTQAAPDVADTPDESAEHLPARVDEHAALSSAQQPARSSGRVPLLFTKEPARSSGPAPLPSPPGRGAGGEGKDPAQDANP
jgi:hypothetical protein